MEVYTARLCDWRALAKAGVPVLDVTVRTGKEASGAVSVFAPEWGLVRAWLAGECNEERYTQHYVSAMRKSYLEHTERWLEVLNTPKLAICCYCGVDDFCHRRLLVDLFSKVAEKHGIPFVYLGEFKKIIPE